jgi:hypothetical protein
VPFIVKMVPTPADGSVNVTVGVAPLQVVVSVVAVPTEASVAPLYVGARAAGAVFTTQLAVTFVETPNVPADAIVATPATSPAEAHSATSGRTMLWKYMR